MDGFILNSDVNHTQKEHPQMAHPLLGNMNRRLWVGNGINNILL